MFKIAVCIKAVPDPELAKKIKIDPKTGSLIRTNIPLVINPLDKNALEAALNIKSSKGAEITVISMGPPQADTALKQCLALGADYGILLSDVAFAGADAYSTALTLARGIKAAGNFDLVICGVSSSDGATEWVGPEISVHLGLPVVTMVSEISEIKPGLIQLKANIENGYRRMAVDLPALLTVTMDLNKPKNLSFSGIIKAKKKEVKVWNIKYLSLSEDLVGLKGSPTIVTEMKPMEKKREIEFINGDREEKATILVAKLVDAGVI
jgi:electron transfer flavoprotein alpha/beta subunit